MCFGTTIVFTCCGQQRIQITNRCDDAEPDSSHVVYGRRVRSRECDNCRCSRVDEEERQAQEFPLHASRAKRLLEYTHGQARTPFLPKDEQTFRDKARRARDAYNKGSSLHPFHRENKLGLSRRWGEFIREAQLQRGHPNFLRNTERLKLWAECVQRQRDIWETHRGITDEDKIYSMQKLEDGPPISFREWTEAQHSQYTPEQWKYNPIEQLRADLLCYEDQYLLTQATTAQLNSFRYLANTIWKDSIDWNPSEEFRSNIPSFYEWLDSCYRSPTPEETRYPFPESMLVYSEFLNSFSIEYGEEFRECYHQFYEEARLELYKLPRRSQPVCIVRLRALRRYCQMLFLQMSKIEDPAAKLLAGRQYCRLLFPVQRLITAGIATLTEPDVAETHAPINTFRRMLNKIMHLENEDDSDSESDSGGNQQT